MWSEGQRGLRRLSAKRDAVKYPVRHADFCHECYRCSIWEKVPIVCAQCHTCKQHCTCPPLTVMDVGVGLLLIPVAIAAIPLLTLWWVEKKASKR